MNLTAYWMVKNDEVGMTHSLESVKERLVPDEYVVLDTGSEDGTMETCGELLADLNGTPCEMARMTFPEPLHFGNARNTALEMCHGDWILQIDSDETIVHCNREALTKLLDEAPEDARLYRVPMQLCGDDGRQAGLTCLPRLFRQGVTYKYGYHEVPNVGDSDGIDKDGSIMVMRHCREHRDAEAERVRSDQREACSETYFSEEAVEDADAGEKWRALMYLGVDRVRREEFEGACDCFRKSLESLGDTPNRYSYQVGHYLAGTLNIMGKFQEAIFVAQKYVAHDLSRCELAIDLGDALCGYGWERQQPNVIDRGRHWFEYAAAFKGVPVSNLFVEVPAHTFIPALRLVRWYTRFGAPSVGAKMRRHWWQEAIAAGAPADMMGETLSDNIWWNVPEDEELKLYLRNRGCRVDEIDTGHTDVRLTTLDDGNDARPGERIIQVVPPDFEFDKQVPRNAHQYIVDSFDAGQLLLQLEPELAGVPIHMIPDDEKKAQRLYRVIRQPGVHIVHEGEDWQIEARMQEALPILGCRNVPVEDADLVIACQPGFDRSRMRGDAKLIFWNTEYLGSDDERQQKRAAIWGQAAEDADIHLSAVDPDTPYPGGACYPFVPDGTAPDVDVMFYGYINDRRRRMLDELKERGIEVKEVFDLDAEALAEEINRAKIVLNLHYYEEGHEYRIWECMACATYVLSELLPSWSPLRDYADAHPWNPDAWAGGIESLLRNDEFRTDWAMKCCQWVWHNFRLDQNLEGVLERVEL